MLKNIVYKQKEERELLLALPFIERTKTPYGKKWIDSNLIKAVLGPRRAGKSVFSLELLKDRPFAYFNFDEEGIPGLLTVDYDELIKELHAVYGDTKNLLFDEIQNLPRWELFVNRLHRSGYNIILTGSNAQLLSKDLATHLTGRHIPIEILPFDFNEFIRAKKFVFNQERMSLPHEKALVERLLQEYLQNGGYPEIVTRDFDRRGYLDVLFDALLFKDVIKRYNVRFPKQIDALGSYLLNNFTSCYTIRKMVNVLGFKSGVTLEKYLGYLGEAYAFFSLDQYEFGAGRRIRSPKKAYIVDNGFITAKAVQHSPDSGKLMENLVFMELVKRGMTPNRNLFYYKTRNGREVDFILKQGHVVTELLQVSYQLDTPNTEEREVRALVEAAGELKQDKLTILTWNEERVIQKNDLTINVVPLLKWLTEKEVV